MQRIDSGNAALDRILGGGYVCDSTNLIRMRASSHDPGMRQFVITPDGIVIGEPFGGTPPSEAADREP